MPRGNAVFWAARGGVAAAPAAMSKAAATGKEGTNPGKDGALAAALDDEYHTFEYDLADLERLEEDEGERQHKRKLEVTTAGGGLGWAAGMGAVLKAAILGVRRADDLKSAFDAPLPPPRALLIGLHAVRTSPGRPNNPLNRTRLRPSGGNVISNLLIRSPLVLFLEQHLLAAIEKNRSKVDLTDKELRGLLVDVKPKGSKWASEDKVGQEDLYSACEMVLSELRNYTEHSMPFLVKVNKRDVPDYYDGEPATCPAKKKEIPLTSRQHVIKNPMDLGTVARNLKNFKYKSKAEFADDLFLIYRNCFEYNTHPVRVTSADEQTHQDLFRLSSLLCQASDAADNIYRVHAAAMKKKTIALMVMVPEIVIRDRADVELADESDGGLLGIDEQKPAPSGAPAAASRECPAPPAVEADLSEVDGARSRSQSLAPARPDEARGTEGVVHPADSGMTEPVKEKTVEREGSSQTEDVEMEDADEDSVTKMWQEVTRQARVFICVSWRRPRWVFAAGPPLRFCSNAPARGFQRVF
ncbi:MAG: hypothetical protein BJ554DRAFT_4247 [Olpidium bornovanus]|uniref:Bromo domain-containing protein n=1 Tax=Olpidium bornovanus TaxID=278681 RepID=A0A8H7ZNA7_9FUNG|nr:MAG: hypothetical protein BJ554DRAFT_4247 [Olpidium bornovanus]